MSRPSSSGLPRWLLQPKPVCSDGAVADGSVWFDFLPAWFRRWMSFFNEQAALERGLRANVHARAKTVLSSSSALMSSNACHTLEREIQNSAIRADLLTFARHISFLSCRTSGLFQTVLFSMSMSKTFFFFLFPASCEPFPLPTVPPLMLYSGLRSVADGLRHLHQRCRR